MTWKRFNCRFCSALEMINQVIIRHKFTCGRTLIHTSFIKDRKGAGGDAVAQNKFNKNSRAYETNNSSSRCKECLCFRRGTYAMQMKRTARCTRGAGCALGLCGAGALRGGCAWPLPSSFPQVTACWCSGS